MRAVTELERVVGPRLPDFATLVLDAVLRVRMKEGWGLGGVTPDRLHRSAAKLAASMHGYRAPPFVAIEPMKTATVAGEWVIVDRTRTRALLYFHGGGFYMGSPQTHRPLTWRLARATGRAVFACEYRKAPEHAFPAWVDDGTAAFHWLLAQGFRPEDVAFAGDSAGGNLALAVTHRLRRAGAPLPAALILFSPWIDLGCEGASYRRHRRRDAMFDANAVRALGTFLTRGGHARDPECSPVHADFRGFLRMLVFAGSTEVFLDDARTLAALVASAGVPIELHTFRHMPHVFPLFAGVLPRAKAAFDTIARFDHG